MPQNKRKSSENNRVMEQSDDGGDWLVQTSDLHTFLVFLLWDKVNISRFLLAKVKLWTQLTHEMRDSPSTTL
jgi:hypothetical protein